MDSDRKLQWGLGIGAVVVIMIIIALVFIHKQEDNIMKQTGSMALTNTYYQDIQQQAKQAQINAQQTPTDQEIAQSALLKQVGLGGNDDAYPIDAVQSSDGIFIKQGIINGNGIPYNSDFNNSSGQALAGIGSLDSANYWENIKNNDYNTMIAKAEAQIQQQNGTSNQTADIKAVIERAKKDQENKNNNLNAKNLKAQFIQKNKGINTGKNKNNKNRSSNSSSSSDKNSDKTKNTNSNDGKSSTGNSSSAK